MIITATNLWGVTVVILVKPDSRYAGANTQEIYTVQDGFPEKHVSTFWFHDIRRVTRFIENRGNDALTPRKLQTWCQLHSSPSCLHNRYNKRISVVPPATALTSTIHNFRSKQRARPGFYTNLTVHRGFWPRKLETGLSTGNMQDRLPKPRNELKWSLGEITNRPVSAGMPIRARSWLRTGIIGGLAVRYRDLSLPSLLLPFFCCADIIVGLLLSEPQMPLDVRLAVPGPNQHRTCRPMWWVINWYLT